MRTTFFQRTIDLTATAVLLIVAFPVMAVVAALVYFCMGRPILFRQMRPGLCGKPFRLLKFRTMREACTADGRPLPDAQRLTRLGRLLRRTSLDELPQLFCVLKGEMSLVGPRPLLMRYLERYSPEQARRHDVKPGLTGWAQVNGRNALCWEEKFALDVWYVDHRSVRLDLWILARTLWKVLRPEGISHAGEATMPEFWGNSQPTDATRVVDASDQYESIGVRACRSTEERKEAVPF